MAKLFKNKIIKQKLENFHIDNFEQKLEVVKAWHKDYHTGSLKQDKEISRAPGWTQDFLGEVLGYVRKPNENHSYDTEYSVAGQRPDFVLAHFGSTTKGYVIGELKDAKTSLDAPQKREGSVTPVQQAFKYKGNLRDSSFVIVSNFFETRLYYDNYLDYEMWTLDTLIDPKNDYFEFRKFIFLLTESNLIAKRGESRTKSLISFIQSDQKEITKKFYKEYSLLRKELFKDIIVQTKKAGKTYKQTELDMILSKTQKIIDRIIFIHFCEDLDLLPNGKLKENLLRAEEIGFSPWEMLKKFFEFVNSGSERLGIPDGYNGGLFHKDEELEALEIGDEICKKFVDLGDYDFEDDLSVNILGHIFEQSISDIEELKDKIQKNEEVTLSKRKKDGVFYTPEYIVDYIVKNSVGKKIEDWEQELKERHNLKEDINDKNYAKRAILVYSELQEKLQNITVLDPACGSGAFLVNVFDFLLAKNQELSKTLEDLGVNQGLFSTESHFKSILQKNIYGVDLNEESVEITKLSLWLKTAIKGRKLANLDQNIKCGNSLIDDPAIAGDKAFSWEAQFPQIFQDGGFDVIVGNPPYVKEATNKNAFQGLHKLKGYQGKMDLWYLFTWLALDIVNNQGMVSFIAPSNWITNDGASKMREKIINSSRIEKFIDFGDYKVFDSAGIQTMIFLLRKCNIEKKYILEYSKLEEKNIAVNDVVNFLQGISEKKHSSFSNLVSNNELSNNGIISFSNEKDTLILDKINLNGDFHLEKTEIFSGIDIGQDFINKKSKAILGDGINIGDGVFNLSGKEFKNYNFSEKEKNYIKPFYTPNEINKYLSNPINNFWVLYTSNDFNEPSFNKEYPNIINHLDRFKEIITSDNKPYGLHRTRNENIFLGEKILSIRKCSSPSFSYSNYPTYVNRTYNIIKTEKVSLKILLPILNSKLVKYWLKYKGKLQGDIYQVDMSPLCSIPIKNIPLSEQTPFIEKADFMLDNNKIMGEKVQKFLKRVQGTFELEKLSKKLQAFYELSFEEFVKELKKKKVVLSLKDQDEWEEYFEGYKSEIVELKTKIDACDREIDEMVFDLYGLSEEEREVVINN